MIEFLKSLFGTKNTRFLGKIESAVEEINSFSEEMEKLSDEELKAKTSEFKKRINEGNETVEDILPEAFAVVREASKRTIKLRHYDVQLIGGIVLFQGKIAEMKTGEGKTLVATLPAYLNALTGKGVHVVTVNEYLAKRDRFWMGPIFEFLGLTAGYVQNNMDPRERQEMYKCDITYVTNNELGFDYLRDNMVIEKEDRVLRGLSYAIVDEVDSILIDEARTPLIISGPSEESTEKYYYANRLVPHLKGKNITEEEEVNAKQQGINITIGFDYIVDEKAHNVTLTESGALKCEKLLGVGNLYDDIQSEWVHHITQALRAHALFKRDVDYVVKDGEVIIVDEFTGRLMPGRRWSDGLHQAVEAKENLKPAEENQTLATVTFQNFFRMYTKTAGMTGTALTEAGEFWDIYKLDVITIPPNKQMRRMEYADIIYKTEKEKWGAIVQDIEESWKKGQPVLVGTRSIEKNEKLGGMLRRKGIPHQLLNAKYHEQEAQIIAQAGRRGAVTVATNMAGRGVDIILGGNPPNLDEQKDVIEKGGLHVIGTERHDARRIDNQLRGRSGRQGDPGSSRFYVALDDELMRLFGGERMSSIMERFGMKEGENIEHPWITKAIENAQKKVEMMNFDIRKQLLEYDNVMNKWREEIYSIRSRILEGQNMSEEIVEMIAGSVDEKTATWASNKHPEEWDWYNLNAWLKRVFDVAIEIDDERKQLLTQDTFFDLLMNSIKEKKQEKEQNFGVDAMRNLERMVALHIIDTAWKETLYELDQLRKGIGFRAYGQKDPLVEFKKESQQVFEQMRRHVRESTVEYIFRVQPVTAPIRRVQPREALRTNKEPDTAPHIDKQQNQNVLQTRHTPSKISQDAPVGKKLGRNDPCPCGSGKKYKKCCGK